jgi:cytochrome c oxidase subunit 2
MAKFFAVTIILIAIGSAIPIVRGTWTQPVDISTHGYEIDHQYHETMWEAGVAFLAAQIILAVFIWKFSNRREDAEIRRLPGGAAGLVLAAVLLVGTEVLALGVFGMNAWGKVYFAPPGPAAMPIQVQAGQFAFYFRYPGPDRTFGPLHPDKINEANENFFGLDPVSDPDSKDDIVAAEMAIPVNQEIHLLMHAKDLGHSFYVRELRVQQDFVPGLDVSLHFTATKVGKYEIVCTQLCGLGHYNMKTYLEVMSQEDFDSWLKQQAALQ